MPWRAEAVVDVRVVDDLAGQKDITAREAPTRLIGVVDGAIDTVTEPELAGEVDCQTAGGVLKALPRRTALTRALS